MTSTPQEKAQTDPGGPRGRLSGSFGVVLVQGLNSLATVVQMALFAIVLARGDFDEYAVWVTSGMFLVGLAQALGADRVLVGRRTSPDGVATAGLLALVVAGCQAAVALAMSSLPLLVASAGAYAYVRYDHQRLTRCREEAPTFLRRDVVVITVQCLTILGVWLVWGDQPWTVLGWWAAALPLWLLWGGSGTTAGATLSRAVRVLRDDARECLPLLVDAVLAGLPLVVVLALANAQGNQGDASAARMAFTILGPVTVLGISGRRLIYQRAGEGRLDRRFTTQWSGVVVASFVLCVALLALTRTPLYPWAFPGFGALAWLTIAGFATNHAAMFSTMVPAARLRAEGRAREVGLSRAAAATASVVVGAVLLPIDSVGDVAWTVGAGSIVYALVLAGTHAWMRPATAAAVAP